MTIDATAPHPSFFARHEKLALVLVNVFFLLLLLGAGEIAARLPPITRSATTPRPKPGAMAICVIPGASCR